MVSTPTVRTGSPARRTGRARPASSADLLTEAGASGYAGGDL
jgi:hypothetical protein